MQAESKFDSEYFTKMTKISELMTELTDHKHENDKMSALIRNSLNQAGISS